MEYLDSYARSTMVVDHRVPRQLSTEYHVDEHGVLRKLSMGYLVR